MKVSDFEIKDEYVSCTKDDKILDILNKVKENKDKKRISYAIVVENQKPIGIISFRDIVLKLVGKKTPLGEIYAETVMTSPIVTVKKDRDAREVYNLMFGMNFGSLPVVDNNDNLLGCVTIGDLAQKMGKKLDSDEE